MRIARDVGLCCLPDARLRRRRPRLTLAATGSRTASDRGGRGGMRCTHENTLGVGAQRRAAAAGKLLGCEVGPRDSAKLASMGGIGPTPGVLPEQKSRLAWQPSGWYPSLGFHTPTLVEQFGYKLVTMTPLARLRN